MGLVGLELTAVSSRVDLTTPKTLIKWAFVIFTPRRCPCRKIQKSSKKSSIRCQTFKREVDDLGSRLEFSAHGMLISAERVHRLRMTYELADSSLG